MQNSIYLGDYRALTKLYTGQKIIVDSRDSSMAPHLLVDGYWAKHLDQEWAKHIRAGDRVMDLGCNIGYTSLILAKLSGTAPVIVDMDFGLLALAQENLILNGLVPRAICGALTHKQKENGQPIKVQISRRFNGGSYVDSKLGGGYHPKENKDILALDFEEREVTQLYPENLPEVDIVKIDLEGMDWMVFSHLIKFQQPRVVFLEHRYQDLLRYGMPHIVEKIVSNSLEQYRAVDVLTRREFTIEQIEADHLDLVLVKR